MGTLGSPEDSGSAPGRLCRHGHAPTPAPLPPCLCRSQGGSATRPQREGAQPPRDQHWGAPPASGWAVPIEMQPPPHAMCQAMPCAGISQARLGGTDTSALASWGAVGRGARGFHNPGLAVYLSAGAGPGGGCLFAESAGSQPRGGGKGSRGTRLGRPARRWGGAGMGMALPAPPRTQLVPTTGGRTPVLPTHTSTQWEAPYGPVTPGVGTQQWLGGGHLPPAQGAPVSVGFPQALPGHGAGRQLSIGLGTALEWCPHMAL